MADQNTAQQAPTNENMRIMMFTLAMTTVVALVLGLLFFGLRPIHQKNEAVAAKRAILSSINDYLPQPVAEMSDDQVQDIFTNSMSSVVVKADGSVVTGVEAEKVSMAAEKKKPADERMYPLFIYNNGKENFYVLSVRGNGLWDEIWGNIALKSDLATIAGASFDHKGETPGLGAEIKDNPKFSSQFADKRIFYDNGVYTRVLVRKGGAKDPVYEVDGISGATVTANGVSEMLKNGIAKYIPYLEEIKSEGGANSKDAIGMLTK